MATNIHSIK